jgi:hypothetical protein
LSSGLVGFVGFILTWNPVAYLVGFTFAIVGFVLAAPTTRRLERDQHQVSRLGCDSSLMSALGEPAAAR